MNPAAEDDATSALAARWQVSGLPTVVAGARRLTGFLRPRDMLAALR